MTSKIIELIPGGYPATPQHENVENNLENKGKDVENKTAKSDVKTNEENDVEKKEENKDLGNKEKTDSENKDLGNKENTGSENKENDSKNKENEELENKENIAKSFPLKFEPNRSVKPTDDNNFAKVTTDKGSSALGGIGLNPATMLGIGSDSPPHPFYQDIMKDKSRESEEPKTFDLNGDYNEQKEKEQIADQEQQQQKSKDERIDLGVKPLGNQPLPSPYKPESEGADRSVHKQTEGTKGEMTPGKTTAVHPESQSSGPRITKKDKINAAVGKAVGIFKQKIGKLVKNDNLVAKGAEKKAEAEKTRELAEVQKTMSEL